MIYADPPWSYQKVMHMGRKVTSAAKMHYSTMTIDDICELPVESIADDDSLLFLWSASPQLHRAMRLIGEWGFEYKTIAFVWDKQLINPGNYTVSQCEMVLVAKRGKIPQPRGARNVRQLYSERRTEHSRKPEEIRYRIEDMFPEQRKIELFARGAPAPGWHAWGNEVSDA